MFHLVSDTQKIRKDSSCTKLCEAKSQPIVMSQRAAPMMGGVLFQTLKRQATKHRFVPCFFFFLICLFCFSGSVHFVGIIENLVGMLKGRYSLGSCDLTLTAVVLVAPVRTVAEAVAAEAADDAVDAVCTGKESGRTLGPNLSWEEEESRRRDGEQSGGEERMSPLAEEEQCSGTQNLTSSLLGSTKGKSKC